MDLQASSKAIARARKRLAHAVAQHAGAESEKARARHARRIRNAQRLQREAVWTFEALSCEEA